MTVFAYCWRSGQIGFGPVAPEGSISFAHHTDGTRLRETVTTIARHAYDGETLLVPGIPEAETGDAALDALRAFQHEAMKRGLGCGKVASS